MIAVDTNVLIHAHNADSPRHDDARAALTGLAEAAAPWGIPVFCIGEFLRVVTHRRVFASPLSISGASASVRSLVESPSARLLRPGPRFVSLLLVALEEGRASGNLVFDAQIVAVCRESGVRSLMTEDRDFARFSNFSTIRIAESLQVIRPDP